MPALLTDIEAALPNAKSRSERRGLLRLQLLVKLCRDDNDLMLALSAIDQRRAEGPLLQGVAGRRLRA
jgi:hypothetical protein